jgi:hypothetical protein
MKVLLLCKGEYYTIMPQIAEAIRSRHGHSVSAIAFATETYRRPQMKVFDHVWNLAAFLKEEVARSDFAESAELLKEYESTPGVGSANTMLYADRILRHYPFKESTIFLASIVRFWRSTFETLCPDVVVGEVASAAEWLGWAIAEQYGIRYLIPYPGPLPRRFNFITSPTGSWDRTRILYEQLKQTGLSANQRQVADDFIENFRRERMRSAIHAPALRSPIRLDHLSLMNIWGRAQRIPRRIGTWLHDGRFDVGSYNGTAPWTGIATDALRVLRYSWSTRTSFEHRIPSGNCVYFPMHVQPEFTIDVRAPFLTDQATLIENIAKSIPAAYKLLVKDHPGMVGRRPMSYYKRLAALSNVDLLSPAIDSHDIIQACQASVTIVGTTAMECILYQKPIIAVGPLAYRFCDLVYNCPNITQLPGALQSAIRDFRPDDELLRIFVCSMLETAHNAEWHDPLATPGVLEQSNINAIADAIVSDAHWHSTASREPAQREPLPA